MSNEMKAETGIMIFFVFLTFVLSPIWVPLAMIYCVTSGKSLKDANGYTRKEKFQ